MARDDCFVIFEGGGAKGITHLGALKALEQASLSKLGVAGSSAGAIVAVLAAVGFSADDLIDVAAHTDLLQRREKTPIDLLGPSDWSVFRSFGLFKSDKSHVAKNQVAENQVVANQVVANQAASNPVADAKNEKSWRRWVRKLALLVPPLIAIWLFSLARTIGRPALAKAAWRVIDTFGFFSTENARDLLNEIIRDKLRETSTGVPDLVCFRDIDPIVRPKCALLKVIATNLEHARPDLFDLATPDVVVADAVAASFCIPLFFKPAQVRRVDDKGEVWVSEAAYADGGLVSNLPVWAFSDDKRAVERLEKYRDGRPIPIVAFRLFEAKKDEKKGASPLGGLVAFAGHVVRTGIFGGQSLPQAFVTHLTVVDLPSSLDVLGFDCKRQEAEDAFEAGRAEAFRDLQRVFRANPASRVDGLRAMVALARKLSAVLQEDRGRCTFQFRACLVRRLGNLSFKVIEGFGMEGDTDDDLILDQRNPGAPTAYSERNFTFVDIEAPDVDIAMSKYEKALLRRSLKSVIAIPIFGDVGEWTKSPRRRKEPVGVFCLDSDCDLHREYADRAFMTTIARETVTRFGSLMTFGRETS